MNKWTRRDLLKSGLVASAGVAASTVLGPANALAQPGDSVTSSSTPGTAGQQTPSATGAAAPQFQGVARERLSLDFGWRFQFGHATDPSKDFGYRGQQLFANAAGYFEPSKPDFDDSKWRAVDVPHDWAVELDFKDDPALVTHGYKPLGREYPETSIGWYRRVFDVPAADAGKRAWIEFEGVFRDAMVALNGFYLGHHASGYAPFRYNVTDFVNNGGKNILVVRVDATLGEGWWYEGAGIYRHVWLTKTNPVHVAHEGVFVTSEVGPGAANVAVSTEVENDSDSEQSCRVMTTVVDASGKVVGSAAAAPTSIPARSRGEFKQQIAVSKPALWSLEEPNLYRAISEIRAGENVVDHCETRFGIRSIRFDPDKGFFLNDKPVKIQGTCNHQDFAGVGVALPDRIHHYRVEKLKEMGSNAYRMSHNPPAPALLDACDQLGMLVMDETRRASSTPEGLEQLEAMIRRDRNHPSIVIWSLGNEEGAIQGNERGARIVSSMKRLVRRLDPSRPVTMAMNNDWGKGVSSVVDVQGFNYKEAEQIDAFHAQFPKQPTVGTETASTLCTRGIYENDKESGYVNAYDVNKPRWGHLAGYWWPVYAERPYLAGGFAWTGFDYRGEPTPYAWPCISSAFGIMDTCGFPKDNFYYYRAWWSGQPVLHLLPHWNWPGRDGTEIDVWCHSNLDAVELFLNGQSLGRKEVPRNSHVSWKVKYAPGTLEARGYKGGKQVLIDRRETTGGAAKLLLLPDRKKIVADGADVSLVEVQVLDAQGRVVPQADAEVVFHVAGPGRLIGVGNGDPSSHEPDKADRRRAFNGRCLAILQSSKDPSEVRLEATSAGLEPATAVIACEVVLAAS